jgi:P-type Cu2+ transporter
MNNPDFAAQARETEPGAFQLELIVPSVHCAGCIGKIERNMQAVEGVSKARLNLGSKRLLIEWAGDRRRSAELAGRVSDLGYDVYPAADQSSGETGQSDGKELLRAIAVAGFAMGNIMLLSVSVWSGADQTTRDLFHWISALIALPAVLYAGRPFFRSALRALLAKSLNMDVPISLAVLLATAMSLFETLKGGEYAYFDAAVTLLLFLLIGRYLDFRMRDRARAVAGNLLNIDVKSVTVLTNGEEKYVPIGDVLPGMDVRLAAGDQVPFDGKIVAGSSTFDRALLTGESLPEKLEPGDEVHAGTVNRSGPVTMRVEAVGRDTVLAEIVRLMEDAEQGRAKYVRIADRAARIYAPLVHLVALLTFAGWMVYTGGDWNAALLAAIAVLIITCPCALGLAVPAVHVAACGRLLNKGILVRDGAGLEKLADIDTVIFDKTGTLTLGRPGLVSDHSPDALRLPAGLACNSRHPLSQALCLAAGGKTGLPEFTDIVDQPGLGLEGSIDGVTAHLGSAAWCGIPDDDDAAISGTGLWFRHGNDAPVHFAFEDQVRPGTRETVAGFRKAGIACLLLSGDRASAVEALAKSVGIEDWHARCLPRDKLDKIVALQQSGHRVLMVGDGINDAPALAAAHASMSPGSAADISRGTANFIFLGARLDSIIDAFNVARRAALLVKQNFALAIIYNFIAVPVAVLGFATPLVAAIAMSSSSILVTLNALRIGIGGKFIWSKFRGKSAANEGLGGSSFAGAA